jgi:PAS domain S-box-containing protein
MVPFFRSLRFRLILLVMAALLPTLGVIIYNAMVERRESTAVAQDHLQRLVALVAREQAQKTMAARHFLMNLALQPAVGRRDVAACNALFRWLQSQPSIYLNVGAVDPEANVFASALPLSGPVNAADKHWFQGARRTRDFAIGKLMLGRISLKPVTVYGYPVLDKAREVQAVLYASISMGWLNDLAGEAQLPSGSVLTIIDNQGTIMAKYPDPEKYAGKSLPPGGLINIIRKDGKGIAEAKGMDGVPRLFAFMPLGRDPQLGFVFAGIPTRVVYAAADQAMQRNLAILGGVLLLALGFAWGFGRLFIMRRINPLVQTTVRLAAGDLAARTGLIGGPEELGQLAQAFDRMAASLEAQEAERQQAEEALKGNMRLNQILLNAFPCVALLLRPQTREIIASNAAAVKVGAVPGTQCFSTWGQRQDPCPWCLAPVLWATGEAQHLEVEAIGIFWHAYWIPVAENLYMHFAFDITERKRMEEALLKYEFIANTSKDCMTLINRNYIYEAANAAFCQAHGKTREKVVGTSVANIWGEDRFNNNIEGYLDRCFTGQTVESEGWFEFGKRGRGCYNVFYKPYFNEDGTVAYAAVVSHNITARKRDEKALLESERKYRLLAENVIDVIWTMDLNWKFTYASPSCESLSGYKDKEIVSMTLDQLLTPDSMDLCKKTMAEILSPENLARQEYPHFILPQLGLRFKDGSRSVYIEIKGSFLKDSQGQPMGMMGVARDITERKQLEEQFLQAQKMEAVGTLAGGIAHDFNNILTAILGNISLAALDNKIGPRSKDRLAQAEAACLRAEALARQLLTFAKGGAPVKKVCSVPELLTESTTFACAGSPVRCGTTFPENLWSVEADPGQIGQVFQNLTINAVQAMPNGGTIKVWAENLTLGTESDLPLSAGRYIKISLRDQGMGIPADHLPRIFDPYFTTKQKGSGLGLASAYAIIKNHHGHIAVESKPGMGTTFHIYLPAVEQQVTPQPEEDKELLFGKGKILVMDDEEMVLEVIGTMLARLGYEAEFARDGGEAIAMFVRAKGSGQGFTMVILDLTVPGGLGGKETMARLLEIDPQVKAIVSSGYSDDPIMADFQKYGFSGVIAKPYRISELGKILNQVIMKKA